MDEILLIPQSEVAAQLLSPGEALLLLIVLTGAVFLAFSSIMAGWTIWFRGRKLSRAEVMETRAAGWKSALQDVLYGDDDAEGLSGSIRPDERIDFLNFLLEYARRLEGDERDLICAMARPHLHRILEYLDHPNEERRMRTVQTLGELGLPDFGDHVVDALDDPSPGVAMVAAATLARAETASYAGEIMTRLDRFAHWRQDFMAAMLATMGADAGPALRWALADRNAPPKARAIAADALAGASDARAANTAHEILTTERDMELRAACLRLLGSVGRSEHVDAVRGCLSAPELPIRLTAVRALGHLGSEADLAALAAIARNDPSPWVAIAAARALKEAGGHAMLEALAGSDHERAALGLQVISEAHSW